jgi:transposase-like protein
VAGIVKTFAVCSDAAMSQPSTRPTLYKGYRFPPEIISQCVWLYYRFGVSLRDVSELMLARGIVVSHEAIRIRTLRFATEYSKTRCPTPRSRQIPPINPASTTRGDRALININQMNSREYRAHRTPRRVFAPGPGGPRRQRSRQP